MTTLILLDTSALLTLRDDGPGASIKACHSLSLADAWIAAAAQQIGATLLHKDPEVRAVTELSQEWLS